MEQKSEDTRKYLCDRCRQFFPMSEIKYYPKGNSRVAMCTKCKSVFDVDSAKEAAHKAAMNQDMPYSCARCNYKFKLRTDQATRLMCPYCGKADKLVATRKNSEEEHLVTKTKKSLIKYKDIMTKVR